VVVVALDIVTLVVTVVTVEVVAVLLVVAALVLAALDLILVTMPQRAALVVKLTYQAVMQDATLVAAAAVALTIILITKAVTVARVLL
jgi:hypothetical protein